MKFIYRFIIVFIINLLFILTCSAAERTNVNSNRRYIPLTYISSNKFIKNYNKLINNDNLTIAENTLKISHNVNEYTVNIFTHDYKSFIYIFLINNDIYHIQYNINLNEINLNNQELYNHLLNFTRTIIIALHDQDKYHNNIDNNNFLIAFNNAFNTIGYLNGQEIGIGRFHSGHNKQNYTIIIRHTNDLYSINIDSTKSIIN